MATGIAHQGTFLGASRHLEKILTRISSIAGWVGCRLPTHCGVCLMANCSSSASTLGRPASLCMARRRGPPSQGWKTFLRNHADGVAAMVPTVSFRLLYGLLIMGHRPATNPVRRGDPHSDVHPVSTARGHREREDAPAPKRRFMFEAWRLGFSPTKIFSFAENQNIQLR